MKLRLFLTACFAFLLCQCGSGDPANEETTLKVGMDLTYPPFEMIDESGNPTGVSVELAKALGEHLGREVEIEGMGFDGLIPALKTGSIDLIISSMTANDKRRESIDFSDPYVRTGLAALVSKGSAVESPEDFGQADLKVVARLGTTGELYARNNLPKAKITALDQDNACVMEVVNGNADLFIYDQLSIFRHHKAHPETTRALLRPFQEEFWAVGIRKGNETLREEVNAFLEAFATDSGFDVLAEKYLSEESALLEEMGIPFLFDVD